MRPPEFSFKHHIDFFRQRRTVDRQREECEPLLAGSFCFVLLMLQKQVRSKYGRYTLHNEADALFQKRRGESSESGTPIRPTTALKNKCAVIS